MMRTNLKWKIFLILAVICISAYYTYANIRWYSLEDKERTLAELAFKYEMVKDKEIIDEESGLSPEEKNIIETLTPEEKARYLKLSRLKERTLNMGLDLQGGMHLVLDVDTHQAFKNQINIEFKEFERYLRKNIKGIKVITDGETDVKISLSELEKYEDVEKILKNRYRHWKVKSKDRTSGTFHLVYNASDARRVEGNARAQALETIRNRVDEFGVAEPSIQPQGDRRIIVQLPGMKDPERAKRLIGRTALLEFKLVDPDPERLKRALERQIPDGYELKYLKNVERKPGESGKEPLLLKITPELTGADLTDAFATFGGNMGDMIVQLKFNRRGGRIMSKISREAVRKLQQEGVVTHLAIVLDGKVHSAPQMKQEVGAEPFIEGNFTHEDATDLALVLRAGALPAPISIEEERTVGASLGADSIRAGVRAAILGLILVAIFVAAYYLLAGLVANFALALNLVVILAVLSFLKATLTLPGIAGVILTIGMAVDANVLIFERIREELRLGKTIHAAIASGYRKAFRTIMDANLTTLIAAFVLIYFGSGPIRGFATTLSLGIIASMFTSIVVTRVIFELLCQRHQFSGLKMVQFVKTPHFRFLSRRKIAFIISGFMIIIGMISFFQRGEDKYGIDFTGGTLVQRSFREAIPVDAIRNALSEIGLSKSNIQQFNGGRGVIIRTGLGQGDYTQTGKLIDDKLQKTFSETLITNPETTRTEMVGPTVGKELRRKAILALSVALILIVVYIAWRFEFKFGIAAVLALLHDILITAGIFSLTGREFSLPIIAALLTIIGYSLNDTIVVFDRIRENFKLGKQKGEYETTINTSLNQTLSRTLLTSLTTFLVVLSLFILGKEIIRDFAFALMIGVVVGTYSSIFIASPVLVEWQARFKKKGAK